MNRKDLPVILALIALLFAWPLIDRHLIRPFFPERPETPAEHVTDPDRHHRPERPDITIGPEDPDRAPSDPAASAPSPLDPVEDVPEEHITIANDEVEITLSSRGAAVVSVRLLDYPRTSDPASGPVVLDFSDRPALAYEQLPGLGAAHSFAVEKSGRRVVFRRQTADGLELTRTLSLAETGYRVQVEDVFANRAEEALSLPPHLLSSGPMRALPGESAMRGVAHLGVDTLSPGGERVRHWGRRVSRLFRQAERDGQPAPLGQVEAPVGGKAPGIDWAAAKNKYFVQILRPEFGAEAARLRARRDTAARGSPVTEVAVAIEFTGLPIEPGQTDVVRILSYYAGPKNLDNLADLGHHQVQVMEFGMWSVVARFLLRVLNLFHRGIPNYGVAIMLLTILIRIVFWPITHKSTMSMRRMQEIQPLVQAVREKHKDNPQRLQRETMAIYKEHKVNPVGGCLPMLIQFPVMIALFVVLRSAIELRFAPFLWIGDLSEPEGLFSGRLPFGLSLNILPLVMTATQFWQQKLNPTAGEPSQQKMMAMMPFIMLVFFYNLASGLVLYWTTNQFLMVAQQLLHQRKKKPA